MRRKYEPIQEEDEESYSSLEKEIARPRSKTKLEKDKENIKKQMTKLEKETSLSSSKSEEEKELLTETDSNSSNWVTECEVTVSQDTSSQSDAKTTVSESDDSQVVVINESDDAQVVILPKAEEDPSKKQKQGQPKREKLVGDTNRHERSRGNIPNSTGSRPYLRSHSGSWRNLRKRRQSKIDKISATLPSEEPFQPNLSPAVKETVKSKDPRQTVELPKISDWQDQTDQTSPSPPAPSSALPAQTGRISRSIENVISKLDRRSMSVLPQIGKTPSEGKFYMIVDLRPVMILISCHTL